MKKIQIICDGCEGDITYTKNAIDYRLTLCSESISISPEVSHAIMTMINPSIKENKYFCDLFCLKRWLLNYFKVNNEIL